jgi:hypothetical protein
MTSEAEELEGSARTAVLVRRSDLPVPLEHPARSFFGGLPKMPPEFAWPKAEVQAGDGAETVALTFIAQIDLAELPASDVSGLLPPRGTLYAFASSVFEDEGFPPCRILYHPGRADALPQAKPPPDLMVLAGGSGYQVDWLDPGSDFHSKVEFKYPLSFLPFRDFEFGEDPVGRELLIRSLCQVLGPGNPEGKDLLAHRSADDFAADEDWPFNWLLVTYMARSVLAHVRSDLTPSSYRKPLDEETRQTLQGFEAAAHEWLRQSGQGSALQAVDAPTKEAFRAWWITIVRAYEGMRGRVSTYPGRFLDDAGEAIDHAVRRISAHAGAAAAPGRYVENLRRRNHWTVPSQKGGSRFFTTAVHQIGGYGSSWQDAPEEHRDDVLLLQIQGEDAFLGWHENSGCVLHFWIGGGDLEAVDFSTVEATLECD